MNFRQLTRAQQNYARRLRERGWRVGISESVSQIAKDIDAFERLIEAAERAAAERAAAEKRAAERAAAEQRAKQRATTMSTREYAASRGISIRTAQRWAAAGKIPAVKNAQGRWVITINAKEAA